MSQIARIPTSQTPDLEDPDNGFVRIEAVNTLAPGVYWRVKKDAKANQLRHTNYVRTLIVGDLHLVVDLQEFDGAIHSALFLDHPRHGNSQLGMILADFLEHMEPATDQDAAAVRAREQADVMSQVQAIQDEIAVAEHDPLALPGVKDKIEKALADLERKEEVAIRKEMQDVETRQADLRRIHRRAARRSEAKGHPLAVRSATISDRLSTMINEGVSADGVRELTYEAKRRTAMASATADYIQHHAERLVETLKTLSPYLNEKSQIAIARSRKAIQHVDELSKGISSLNLYTGTSVDVVTVTEGKAAPTDEPLTLMQAKTFMDEELAVWCDVSESFDWTSQSEFFGALRTNASLRDQLLPSPRCVVAMAVTRRNIQYGSQTSPFARMQNELENKLVFLLVRNGENVHAVYSTEPSHEAAARLFPTQEDLREPFRGLDGSQLSLRDVAFGSAVGDFEDMALHYRRFLILLCGLDHREKLFGEFYPPEQTMNFMSLPFQERYFQFVSNDDPATALPAADRPNAMDWMKEANKALRSGSRVIVGNPGALASVSPGLKRQSSSLSVNKDALRAAPLIAVKRDGDLCIQVPVVKRHWNSSDTASATCWLTGPESDDSTPWFLCVDRVSLSDVRHYIHHRPSRVRSIAWLLTLRRVEHILECDALAEAELRAYLKKTALEARVLAEDKVDQAIADSVATWRADNRGAPAPNVDQTKEVNAILNVMYPADRLAGSVSSLVEDLVLKTGLKPLKLTRTGKSKLVLYAQADDADKAPYSTGVRWGWVKRLSLATKKTGLSVASSSLTWLDANWINAAEEEIQTWPDLQQWVNTYPEPIKPAHLKRAKDDIEAAEALAPMLIAARGSKTHYNGVMSDELLQQIAAQAREASLGEKGYKANALYVMVPLALYEPAPGKAPIFIYATAQAAKVVQHYADPEGQKRFNAMVSREQLRKITKGSMNWKLAYSEEIAKAQVLADIWNSDFKSPPDWAQQKTHKPGGKKVKEFGWSLHKSTRKDRRQNNGSPNHDSVTAALSFNRAFDTLLGVNPRKSRDFYKSLPDRLSWHFGFDKDIPALKKAERLKRFDTQSTTHIQVNDLAWNDKAGRSHANRCFSLAIASKNDR